MVVKRTGRTGMWGASALLALLAMGCGRVGFDKVAQNNGSDESDAGSSWAFIDNEGAEFEMGDFAAGTAQLAWNGEQVQFAGAPPYSSSEEGVFVSAIFDTGDPTTIWETFGWVPSAPNGRALPDGGTRDSGYASRGIDMADNIMLLHLDDQGLLQDDKVVDSSGTGRHGSIVLSGQSVSTRQGQFGSALDLDRDAWVHLDGLLFDFGTSDFTYSVWVIMRDCSASNDNRIALGGGGASDEPHMWIGALCPDPCPDGDGAYMNFKDDTRSGPNLNTCTGVPIDDGKWHHLAGVKRGHTSPPSLVQLFVDGREVNATTYDFGANTFTYAGGELRLGGFNLGGSQYNTSIVVDEAAIWKRALSDAEIESIYLRGAVDLGLQIRVCAESGCTSETFVGPDGTGSTYFTEAELTGAAGSQSGNIAALGLVGPKAQYRARFATSAGAVSPGLRSVRLEARKPQSAP